MLQYEADHGTLPPAFVANKDGKRMHSWRVLILPYLEQQSLYDQYKMDEPWDGPNNSLLASQMPKIYACPSGEPSNETQYAVMAGPGLVFDGANKTRIADIATGDGTDKTLLVVECHEALINWLEPRDLDAATTGPTSHHPKGVNVSFADGHVRFLKNDISPEVFGALITPRGGEAIDENQLD
jgi:prepilin-type processing-associated H-X9-DG protein